MSFFFSRLFRSRQKIATATALEDFLDGNAAYVSQKAIYEYSRAAAGYLWQPLFGEDAFKAALERSRWLSYPRGLELVVEIVEGVVRPHSSNPPDMLAGLQRVAMSAMDRHIPPPDAISADEWNALGASVLQRTGQLQAHPVRAVKDIANTAAEEIFSALPIHEIVRGRDPVLLRNNLVTNLLAVHDAFVRRADAPALARPLSHDPVPR